MTSNLKRVLAGAAAMVGLVPALALGQRPTTVAGRVTNETGAPLQGATVSIAALGIGAYTGADGRYTFTVPATRSTGQALAVTARRIGYIPKSVTLTMQGGVISQDFSLTAAPTQLTGVVVTALGVEREKSQLGTAQQQVSSKELTQTKAQSVVQDLEGKVSGVTITGTGSPGGSDMIVIRGSNSITGDNTPLFIVDGVPIVKSDRGANPYGGWDFGSTVNDINPDDIETMSVLKGPNAAALYGSRAANGVIIITTKKGANSGGRVRTELNSFYTWDTPSRIPDYQNQYGQGAGGEFMYVDGLGDGVNDGLDQSFGPKLDGRTHGCTFVASANRNDPIHIPASQYDQTAPCLQFTSPNAATPWIAHPNNVASFFQTAHTGSATLAVSGGTDRANARLSAGTDNSSSIIPGTYLTKTNAMLSGDLEVSPRLSTEATVNYIRNNGRNRPGQGYGNSILESFVWFGRQVDMNALRNNWQKPATLNNGPVGREYNWNYDFHNNPFFLMYGNPENDLRDRLIGTTSATYKVTDWLNATGRVGSDWYRLGINQDWSPADITGAPVNPSYAGAFNNTDEYNNETNFEGLLTANKSYSRITLNGMLGGNIRKQSYNTTSVSTQGISSPGIFNVSNSALPLQNYQYVSQRQVNSIYGSASYTLDGWWTLEGTARNDWSSTLPKGKNSYFYPSANTSVVLTDAIPSLRNRVLSYLKLRGSIAQVGNDAPVYSLATTYSGSSNKFNGQPLFSYSNTVANPALKPEITQSAEGGIETSFFNGRASLDASYYAKSTKDQIFNITVSPATGFSTKSINAGRVDNKGVEGLLTIVPVQMANGFQWTSTFNYARNRSRVVSLYPGIQTIVLGSWWGVNVEARQGEPYGALRGKAFLRDSATGQLITNGGLTMSGPLKVLGNINPDWVGGWNNTFTYKHLTVSGLLDIHTGGNLWSITNYWGDYAGVLKHTMMGREVDWNKPGVLVHGLDVSSCAPPPPGQKTNVLPNGTYRCINGKANTDTVTSELYFQDIYPVAEGYVYKDSWVKLRELRIGLDLPERYANMLRASAVNIAFTGRNLFTSTTVPNVDPEANYSTSQTTQGVEYGEIPNARSLGISVRVTP